MIDTSIWLDFTNKKSEVELAQHVQELMARKQAAWCPMIQLELQRAGKESASALALIDQVLPCPGITPAVWQLAQQLAQACTSKGKPVPNTDILIDTTAQHHGCQIFYKNKHFDWLAEINNE